ncbi:hypothetical protein D3C74_403750 [compost metagenome]
MITVKFSPETYYHFQLMLKDLSRTQNKPLMLNEIEKLNGFPRWSGIIAQHSQLFKYLKEQALKHSILIYQKEKKVLGTRKPVRVFKD